MRKFGSTGKAYKWLAITAATAGVAVLAAYLLKPGKLKRTTYYPVDPAKKYTKPDGWKGTPVDANGRFMNAEYPFIQDYRTILVWLPGHIANMVRNRHRRFPAIHQTAAVLHQNNTLIWLGHASFFLRINHINILIDPQFYHMVIYKRHTPNPIAPELFRNIDYILISHDHADHCDKKSLQLLIRNNPGVTFITGLKMDKLIRSFTPQAIKTVAMDWYEKVELAGSLTIHFVPSRHYCARIFDRFNIRLWGGFVVSCTDEQANIPTIFYGGDSGYDEHFKDIRTLFAPALAILPIGAYLPQWFMHPNHLSPEEALQAFDDCGAEKMIPMHYGTFNLSNEDMELPLQKFKQITAADQSVCLTAGEVLSVEHNKNGK